MNLTYTILKLTEDTYKYQIYVDDVLTYDQDFKPLVEGFQSMTMDEAKYWAEYQIEYIKNPPAPIIEEVSGTLDGATESNIE